MKQLTETEKSYAQLEYTREKIAAILNILRCDLQSGAHTNLDTPHKVDDFIIKSIKDNIGKITELFDMENIIK